MLRKRKLDSCCRLPCKLTADTRQGSRELGLCAGTDGPGDPQALPGRRSKVHISCSVRALQLSRCCGRVGLAGLASRCNVQCSQLPALIYQSSEAPLPQGPAHTPPPPPPFMSPPPLPLPRPPCRWLGGPLISLCSAAQGLEPRCRGCCRRWLPLGGEPVPGTPEHRDAYINSCKLLNEAMKQPAAQRDVAWMVEEAKRNMRLGTEYYQARVHTWSSTAPQLGCRSNCDSTAVCAALRPAPCRSFPAAHTPLPLLRCYPRAAATPGACLQAEAERFQRDVEWWTQKKKSQPGRAAPTLCSSTSACWRPTRAGLP